MKDFTVPGKLLAHKTDQQDEHTVRGTIEATNVDLTEDFAATWGLTESGNAVEVIAYRNLNEPATPSLNEAAQPAPAAENKKSEQKTNKARAAGEPGYFEATAQLTAPVPSGPAGQESRTVVVLMDTSLSMQWEKLERSYVAAAKLLESLRPQDRFNLLLFNTRVDNFRPSPVAADPATVMAAMDWLRASHLRGGTDFERALDAGLTQTASPQSALVLLTDGGADRGEIRNGKLAAWYAAKWSQIPPERRPKTDVFAVGDDANLPLLRMLSHNDGVHARALE